jgi:catechol 2,3-dioxygenase-like lactoylglutathione lyase family enzyme
MRFTGVIVFCEDIKAQTAWYRDVLGLAPDEDQPFEGHRFVRFSTGGDAALMLHSGTKPNGGRQKLTMDCDSIEALVGRLKASGRRVKKLEPASQMLFDFKDPEGNRVQVYGPW